MNQVCLSEIIAFIKIHAQGTNAFRDWFTQEQNDSEYLWISLLATSGHVFTAIEDGCLVGVCFFLPKSTDNEYHLSQLLTLEKRHCKLLYENFKKKFPEGKITTAYRRGRLINFKNTKTFERIINNFK